MLKSAVRRALTTPPTDHRIVGREQELASLISALDHGKSVVTVVGMGGIGKTALVLAALGQLTATYTEHGGSGAVYVELAHCTSANDVINAISTKLRLRSTDHDPIEQIGRWLARRNRILLMLDNVEQIASPIADLIQSWSRSARTAQFVLTSRVSLPIASQHIISLGPLASEPDHESAQTDPPALSLFIDRWCSAAAVLTLTAQQRWLCAKIVASLGGHPLSLELAANRGHSMTLEQLADDSNHRHLSHPTATGRHRSLEQVLHDSLSLLPSELAPYANALVVFRSTVEPHMFAAVAREINPTFATTALSRLFEFGIITRDAGPAQWDGSFVLLEPVREILLANIDPALHERLRIAHATCRAAEARQLAEWWMNEPSRADQAIRRHFANWRSAVAQAVAGHVALATAKPLLLAYQAFLAFRGQHRERIDLLLAASVDGDLEATAALARARRETGDFAAAKRDWQRVLESTASGQDAAPNIAANQRARVTALVGCAELDEVAGDVAVATEKLREALQIASNAPAASEAEVRGRLAHLLRRTGDIAAATSEATRAHALFEQAKHDEGIVAMTYELGVLAMFADDPTTAHKHFDRGITLGKQLQTKLHFAACCVAKGILLQSEGQIELAINCFSQAIHDFRELENPHRLASAKYSLASAYLEQGDSGTGLAVASRASALLANVAAPRYQALVCALQAIAAQVVGSHDEAKVFAERARAAARAITSEHNVTVAVELAFAYVAGAAEQLEQALASARTIQGDDAALFARLVKRGRAEKPQQCLMETSPGVFVLGDQTIDLSRRFVLRRLVDALLTSRTTKPGHAMSFDELVSAGWPNESVGYESASNRLHVALTTLRNLGLRTAIQIADGGYLIDPALFVEVARKVQ